MSIYKCWRYCVNQKIFIPKYSLLIVMAKVIDKKTKKEVKVKDGGKIKDACAKLGVSFSCGSGVCGTCQINVTKGEENLSPLNDAEKDMGMGNGHRLACQCKISKGEIEIEH